MFKALLDKKNRPLLILLLAALALVAFSFYKKQQTKENYNVYFGGECYSGDDDEYVIRRIYLSDMSGGMSTAQAFIEKKCKKLYINLEAALPYARGGTFISLDGIYNVYIINKETGEQTYIGTLNREDFRVYYLKAVLEHPFEYKKHGIMITRKTRNHKEKPILVGF